MKSILTWFPPQGNYMKNIFDMIFHLKAAQNFIAEHEERDFELIFQFNPFSHSDHCIGPPSKISILV